MMRRYILSGAEQALTSLLTLGANLALIRLVTPESYGAFAFWANLAFVLASVQVALTGVHLNTLPASAPERRAPVERLMRRVTLSFLFLVGGALLAVTLAFDGAFANPAAALFVPSFLFQQHVRTLAFSRGRIGQAVVQSGAALVLGAFLLLVAVKAERLRNANEILLCLGLAYAAVGAGAALLWRIERPLAPTGATPTYWSFARNSGWVFLGVASSEVLERFYVFVVGALFGPALLATLAASQLLLRPIPMLAGAWASAARPGLVQLREENRRAELGRRVRSIVCVGLLAATTWTGAVYLGRDLIFEHLFHDQHPTLSWAVLLWGVSAGLGLVQLALNTTSQVMHAFRPLATANLIAALVAAVAILTAMQFFGVAGAILGMLIGQFTEIALMTGVLIRILGPPKP